MFYQDGTAQTDLANLSEDYLMAQNQLKPAENWIDPV